MQREWVAAGIVAIMLNGALRAEVAASQARPESPAVLLEKGIFLEETAGDLAGAAKVYQQIAEDAQANRKVVADAMYRWGNVLVKQKRVTQAGEVLARLEKEYPEQKELAGKARIKLAEVRAKLPPEAVGKVVDEVVKLVSGMTESDPKLPGTISRLDGLNSKVVVEKLSGWLDAKVPEERRAAIYLLWKGPLGDVSGAEAGLVAAMKNEEGLTRGMAAITLAGRKLEKAYPAILEMAEKDANAYARSGACYAAALTGSWEAKTLLEKLTKDKDEIVAGAARHGLKVWAESAGGMLPLNQTIERVVNDDGMNRDMLIDLDTGKLFTPDDPGMRGKEMEWMASKGIDAGAETSVKGPGLYGIDMAVVPLATERWEDITIGGLRDDVERGKPGTPAVMSALGELPRTYAFKTREGSVGVLQILALENDKAPRHIKIRYKLLAHGTNPPGGKTQVTPADKREAEKLAAAGWKLWNERKLAEAEEKFALAVEKDPANANSWNGLGWSQLNQGKKENARAAFEKAVGIDPKAAASWNGLGWIAKGEGKVEEAKGFWKRAYEASPVASAAISGLAGAALENGDYQEAIGWYEKWLKSEAGNSDAKVGLEKARAGLAAVSEARPAAESWLKLTDEGKYAESWTSAAALLQKSLTQDAWEKALKQARPPLGKMTGRKLKSAQFMTSLPGAPDGSYVVLQFDTSFENKKQAIETVTPMKDSDGKWKVSGYFVK